MRMSWFDRTCEDEAIEISSIGRSELVGGRFSGIGLAGNSSRMFVNTNIIAGFVCNYKHLLDLVPLTLLGHG